VGIVGRLFRILLVVALVVAVAVGSVVGFVSLRALPQSDGVIQIDGLESSVTVLRDSAGIVRILANNPHDLFVGQGYVHAQERLWQMEVWRHISSGRLSELFGKGSLDQDRFIRTLGWRQAAKRDLDALSPEPRAALDAYAEGVNAYTSAGMSSSRGRRSIRWPGRRSRAGSWAETSMRRSSGCSPTRNSAIRR
jgi:penicillin amidase